MRRLSSTLLSALLLTGCGDDATVISGTLLDSSASGQVWIDEEVDRFDIANGEFRVEGTSRDTIDLQFTTSGGESGRMRILGLPGGTELTLDGIWLDGGMAFATDASLGEGRVININGLRMGSLSRISDGDPIEGTLLAIDRDGESLIIRPVDADMPDLRVAVGEGTVITGPNDTPSSLDRLEFGDAITVAGEVQGRYLMAAQLLLPESAATAVSEAVETAEPIRAEQRDEEREEAAEEAREAEEPRRSENPGRGRGFRPGRRNGF